MFHSAEARWFVPEVLRDEVLNWFRAGRPLDSQEAQLHEYLLFPGCDTVGVKLREGKFEIKAVLSKPRPLSRHLTVKGRMDRWVKWSLASEGLKRIESDLHRSGGWLKVI